MRALKKYQGSLALAGFIIVITACIVGAVYGMHFAPVPVACLMMIEAVCVAVLYNTELWIHGVLVVAQLIAGVASGKLMLVLLCVAVYIAAVATLHFMRGKKE